MQQKPIDGFHWICRVQDHFSQFHIIWPLKRKCRQEVSDGIRSHLLAYYGMPKNFQSDETVIVNQLVQNLFEKEWKGKALLFLLIKCII
jgi:hypothetical protein